MTGMRAFNYEFVKSFPISSKEFEIETEMSVFALTNNFTIKEILIDYKNRGENSESKLNTYKDGFKVISTIFALIRDEKPLLFFFNYNSTVNYCNIIFYSNLFKIYQ